MPRNFDRRVEILVPVTDKNARLQLVSQIMAINLQDTEQSWELGSGGEYTIMRGTKDKEFNAHQFLMEMSNTQKFPQRRPVQLKTV